MHSLPTQVRTGNKPESTHPLLHALLAPTRMAHGDTALMCLATSQIIYSFIVMPSTLPPVRACRVLAGRSAACELGVCVCVRVRTAHMLCA